VTTFPKSEDYDVAGMLTSLGIGEAAVTVLSERGTPTPVAWTMLRSPRSLMGPVDPAALQQAVDGSPLNARYGQPVDRESAYERLAARLAPPPAQAEPAPEERPPREEPERRGRATRAEQPDDDGVVSQILGSAAFRSFARSAASSLGREITRGLFGTRKRRR
jgi:hypothetical protein